MDRRDPATLAERIGRDALFVLEGNWRDLEVGVASEYHRAYKTADRLADDAYALAVAAAHYGGLALDAEERDA